MASDVRECDDRRICPSHPTRCCLIAALICAAAPAAAEGVRLRAISFNVWGLPVVAPDRVERVQAIGPALAELEPDLVALQEVWVDEDAEYLEATLADAGLPFALRFDGDRMGDGLLVLSRYPVVKTQFTMYSQGLHPHVPWHLDWISRKGIGRVRIETPVGEVDFAVTHMQATYDTHDYLFVQIAQVLEAAELITESPQPLIVAGDLNSPWNGLPFRLLAAYSGLVPTQPRSGIDAILFRQGRSVEVRPLAVREVLTEPMAVGDGHQRLSDHPALLADFELARCEACAPPATAADRRTWLAEEVAILVRAELRTRQDNLRRDRTIAASLLGVVVLGIAAMRRAKIGKRQLILQLVLMGLLGIAGWFGYLGVSFGPAHIRGLHQIQLSLHGPGR